MICKSCGENIPQDSKFCASCGATVKTQNHRELQPREEGAMNAVPAEVIEPEVPAANIGLASRTVCTAIALLTVVSLLLSWFSFRFEAPWTSFEMDPEMTDAYESSKSSREYTMSLTPFGMTDMMRQTKKSFADMRDEMKRADYDSNEIDTMVSAMGIAEIIGIIISSLVVLAIIFLGCFIILAALRPRLAALLGQLGSISAFAGALIFGVIMLLVGGFTGMVSRDLSHEGIEYYMGNSPVVPAVLVLSVVTFVLITAFKKNWRND